MMQCVVAKAPQYLDADACRWWWLQRIHPAGACCPSCGVAIIGRQAETWRNDGRIHCNSCGRWYTNRTGTPLEGTTATWQQLFLMALLLSGGYPSAKIAVLCQLSDDTVRAWRNRFQVAA